MTEFAPPVQYALDRWTIRGATPDWNDVLRRAGVRARRPIRTRYRLAAIALVVAAASIAAPALGLVSRIDNLFGPSRRGFELSADLRGAGSATGELTLHLENALVVVQKGPRGRLVPKVFGPVGGRRRASMEIRWSLSLRGLDAADSMTIRSQRGGRLAVHLCAPCRSGSSGSVRIRLDEAAGLIASRAYADVRAGDNRLTGTIVASRLRG